ncbi:MAG TPA: hypothetical protein DEA08_36760 [Planctomycetes bacterium]|nr:hypothetical protein [Planctomycetota bacterium]
MARRPAQTLVLITGDRLVRADRASSGELLELLDQERPEVDDLAVLVDAALRAGDAKPAKDVYVLASDLWSQTVELPAAAALNASPAELSTALTFEVEALTGTSAGESALGFQPLPGGGAERRYWVTLAPAFQVRAVEDVVTRAGARLGGLLHPGGLPRPLNGAPAGAPWARLELWEELTFDLHGAGAELDLEIDPGRPPAPTLPAEEGRHREVLALHGRDLGEAEPEVSRFELDDVAKRQTWLRGWGDVLRAPQASVPLVRPVAQPMSSGARLALALVLAALAIAACAGHSEWLAGRLDAVQAELKAREAPAAEAARLQKRQRELRAERAEIGQEVETLRVALSSYRGVCGQHTDRHVNLLRLLARAPESLVVERIRDTGAVCSVEGLADDPGAPAELARSLAEGLAGSYWRVSPPNTQALYQRQDGGPWSFVLRLEDTPPLPQTTPGGKR